MGWLSCYCPNGSKDVFNDLLNDGFKPHIVLDHAIRGNVGYFLIHNGSEHLICVAIAQSVGERDWAHKVLDETMGPYYYDCPERILRKSTCTNEGAVAWREKCRSLRNKVKTTKEVVSNLKKGDIVYFQEDRELSFIRSYNKGNTQFIASDEKGNIYRYRSIDIDLEKQKV